MRPMRASTFDLILFGAIVLVWAFMLAADARAEESARPPIHSDGRAPADHLLDNARRAIRDTVRPAPILACTTDWECERVADKLCERGNREWCE